MRIQRVFIAFLFVPLVAMAQPPGSSASKPVLRVMYFPDVSQSNKVNINTADAAMLSERLKGVGEKKARAIVEYRQKNGPFRSLRQLEEVKGIGAAIVQKNRHVIVWQ